MVVLHIVISGKKRGGISMAFGMQTFNEDGSVDFDSSSQLIRVIHKQTVTGNTSINIQNYAPPYFVIILTTSTDGGALLMRDVTPVSYNQSGSTINIVYRKFISDNRESRNFPATVLVCK